MEVLAFACFVSFHQSSEENVAAAAEHVKGLKPGGVDYLLNNAGATHGFIRGLMSE